MQLPAVHQACPRQGAEISEHHDVVAVIDFFHARVGGILLEIGAPAEDQVIDGAEVQGLPAEHARLPGAAHEIVVRSELVAVVTGELCNALERKVVGAKTAGHGQDPDGLRLRLEEVHHRVVREITSKIHRPNELPVHACRVDQNERGQPCQGPQRRRARQLSGKERGTDRQQRRRPEPEDNRVAMRFQYCHAVRRDVGIHQGAVHAQHGLRSDGDQQRDQAQASRDVPEQT